MKELKIIDTGEVHFYSLPGLSYYTVTGMTKDGTEYNARREDIFSILQQQAELTREETIKECIEAVRLPDEPHWHGELCDEYHCGVDCRFIQADRCVGKLSNLLTTKSDEKTK